MKILRILFITILFFVVKTVVAIAVEQKLPDDLYSEQEALQVFQEKFEAEYEKLQAKKDQEGNQLTEEEIAKIQSMYYALVLKNMQFFKKIQNIAPKVRRSSIFKISLIFFKNLSNKFIHHFSKYSKSFKLIPFY